ncbi:hypothetical protein HG530_003901 [Fusarium avenaceum]|nr:hypothetical protein HG530_003901 [Fusarium avenaceum]
MLQQATIILHLSTAQKPTSTSKHASIANLDLVQVKLATSVDVCDNTRVIDNDSISKSNQLRFGEHEAWLTVGEKCTVEDAIAAITLSSEALDGKEDLPALAYDKSQGEDGLDRGDDSNADEHHAEESNDVAPLTTLNEKALLEHEIDDLDGSDAGCIPCTRAHRNLLPDIDAGEEAYTISDHGAVFDYDLLRSKTIGGYHMRPRSKHNIATNIYEMIVSDTRSSTRPVDALSDLGTQHSQRNGGSFVVLTKQGSQIMELFLRIESLDQACSPSSHRTHICLELSKEEVQDALDNHDESEEEEWTEETSKSESKLEELKPRQVSGAMLVPGAMMDEKPTAQFLPIVMRPRVVANVEEIPLSKQSAFKLDILPDPGSHESAVDTLSGFIGLKETFAADCDNLLHHPPSRVRPIINHFMRIPKIGATKLMTTREIRRETVKFKKRPEIERDKLEKHEERIGRTASLGTSFDIARLFTFMLLALQHFIDISRDRNNRAAVEYNCDRDLSKRVSSEIEEIGFAWDVCGWK